MPTAEVFPLAPIGDSGSYPAWIRGLRHVSGVYVIREVHMDGISYVGESHTNRLYSTLTRHFQQWSDAHNTAGATYDREHVEVAVIVVPAGHALYLQNEFICALDPTDNRLKCDALFDMYDEDDDHEPPEGYDYDVEQLVDAIAYQWPDSGNSDLSDVPF